MDKMMHPIVDVGIHPKSMYIGIFLLDKPDLDKPESWIFYILATWQRREEDYEGDRNMVDELKRRMDGWADPYKSAVEWIPDEIHAKAVPFRIWRPTKWDNRGGRVTLSGDAAHSMTFRKFFEYFSRILPSLLSSSIYRVDEYSHENARSRPRSQQCHSRQRALRQSHDSSQKRRKNSRGGGQRL